MVVFNDDDDVRNWLDKTAMKVLVREIVNDSVDQSVTRQESDFCWFLPMLRVPSVL